MDVRIGVTQSVREIELDVDDSSDRSELHDKVSAALAAGEDSTEVLWLTDKRGREVGVPAAKIAYVEIGPAESQRSIGFSA